MTRHSFPRSHPQSLLSLTSPLALSYAHPSQSSSTPLPPYPLYTPSLSYLLPRCCSSLCSYPRCSHDPPLPFLQVFALNSLTQLGLPFCTSLSSQNCKCPSMTLCPFPQAIFPHNTHPFYSIEVIWLLGLFLQSVMSTFEYKLHENGDFCLYCSLSLEKYLTYSRCSVNTS